MRLSHRLPATPPSQGIYLKVMLVYKERKYISDLLAIYNLPGPLTQVHCESKQKRKELYSFYNKYVV